MRNPLKGLKTERITAADVAIGDVVSIGGSAPASVTKTEQRDTNMGTAVVLHFADGDRVPLQSRSLVYRVLGEEDGS